MLTHDQLVKKMLKKPVFQFHGYAAPVVDDTGLRAVSIPADADCNGRRLGTAIRRLEGILYEREQHMLDPQPVDQQLRLFSGSNDFDRAVMVGREHVEHGPQLGNQLGHVAAAATGGDLVKQAADASDTLAGVERLVADVPEHFGRPVDERVRPVQQALPGLRECRDRAQRLVDFVGDAARHLGERGDTRNFHQLVEESAG